MLVITRKTGEELLIGSEISVKVLDIKAGKVVLGVTAPDTLTVRRASGKKAASATVEPSLEGAFVNGVQKNS